MKIIGIHQGHNATACLLVDGEIKACVSEERFTRLKNQAGLPTKAIDYCLKKENLTPDKIDFFVLSNKTIDPTPVVILPSTKNLSKINHFHRFTVWLLGKILVNIIWPLEYRLPFAKLHQRSYQLYKKVIFPNLGQKRKKIISEIYKIPYSKIIATEHHQNHGLAALFSSPLSSKREPILIFTCDGEGDNLSATVSIFSNNKVNRIAATPFENSLGALYSLVTIHLGMRHLEDEHKVMGLADYADPEHKVVKHIYNLLSQKIWLDENKLVFRSKFNTSLFHFFLKKQVQNLRFDYVAKATQKFLEDILTAWVKAALKKTGVKKAVFGGGVFLNIKANKKITEIPEMEETFFMPSSGDESNAIGAVYNIWWEKTGKIPKPLSDLYLGSSFSNQEIKEILDKESLPVRLEYHENIEKKIAELLARGEIVARFSGKMEWGARALGNRSILADASLLDIKDKINKSIKSRDFWMPFSPTILKEREKDYIKNPKNIKAPFMILAFDTTKRAQKDLKAALHPYDETARPQILEEKDNPPYYKLIKEFEKITGRGGILNTSFNLHGEPIVCSPQDALETLKKSQLKYLALENYLVEKI